MSRRDDHDRTPDDRRSGPRAAARGRPSWWAASATSRDAPCTPTGRASRECSPAESSRARPSDRLTRDLVVVRCGKSESDNAVIDTLAEVGGRHASRRPVLEVADEARAMATAALDQLTSRPKGFLRSRGSADQREDAVVTLARLRHWAEHTGFSAALSSAAASLHVSRPRPRSLTGSTALPSPWGRRLAPRSQCWQRWTSRRSRRPGALAGT